MKSYYPISIKKNSVVSVTKESARFVVEVEDNNQIVRLYFDDLKSLCEIMFFEIAEKIQPFMKGGE